MKIKNYDIRFHTWKLMKLETIFDDVWVRAREREPCRYLHNYAYFNVLNHFDSSAAVRSIK